MTGAPSLLLIEGNEGHSFLIQEKFLDAFPDAEITCAKTLDEASRLLPTKSWDLVITNAKMPDGRAANFLDDLSARQPFAAVAILTETIEDDEIELTGHRGAIDILTKDRSTLDSFVTRVKRLMAASKRVNALLNQRNDPGEGMIFRDAATQVYNRAYFEDAFHREIERANRHRQEVALLVVDIDGFSEMVDRKGETTGLRCLRNLSSILTSSVRIGDIVARFDDHQFMMLLDRCRKTDAVQAARRVLESVKSQGGADHFSVSIGVLHYRGAEKPVRPRKLVARAQEALDTAKKRGGARFHIAA